MGERIKHKFSASVTTVVEVDNKGPQCLRFLYIFNTTAAVAYLQLFNLPSASVTLGTTVPCLAFGIPASAAAVIPIPEAGLRLDGSGISVAGTTTRGGLTTAALDIVLGWGN